MPTRRCQVVSSHDAAAASRAGPASRSSAFENRDSASAGGRIASLAAVVAESSRSASSIDESAAASLRSHSSTADEVGARKRAVQIERQQCLDLVAAGHAVFLAHGQPLS